MEKMGEEDDSKNAKKLTRISVADFEVESSESSLKELEDCMNRLIKRNKDFAKTRRAKALLERQGMIG